MRALLASFVLVATPVFAQAISGTLSAQFVDFNEFGVARTRLTLTLQCSLTCDASAPEKSFGVAGGTSASFVAAPMESTGYVGSGFGSDPTGMTSYVSEQFDPGTAFIVRSKSVTCRCGNRTGEGGYVDLESGPVAIPPWLTGSSFRAGDEESVIVNAQPRGGDTVQVRLLGAGLDETRTLTTADFGTQKSLFVRFVPTQPGALTVTATLQPYGAARTLTVDVAARPSSTGGGSGGTGGGSGGGGGADPEPEPFGCSATALSPVLLAMAALLRRRRE